MSIAAIKQAEKRQAKSDWEQYGSKSLNESRAKQPKTAANATATTNPEEAPPQAPVVKQVSEKQRQQQKIFPIPSWCESRCPQGWHIEVYRKDATVCDMTLDHDSCSRHHVAMLYNKSENGMYVMDLSSHGTFINGQRLPKKEFVRWAAGTPLQTANSSRTYILCTHPYQRRSKVEKDPAFKALMEELVMMEENGADEENDAAEPVQLGDVQPEENQEEAVVEVAPPTSKVYRMAHILMKHVESANPTWKKKPVTRTKVEAARMLETLRCSIMQDPESFGKSAEQYSECASGKKGGMLPELTEEEAPLEFLPLLRALDGMEPNEISPVVETKMGMHLLRKLE